MQDGPTISNLPEGHNLTTSTVVVVSPAATITPGSPLVKVLIKYPADWKKDKFFKDGDVKEVSPETAETFVEVGIATIVNGDGVNADETDEDADDEFNGNEQAYEVELLTEEQALTEADSPVVETKKGGKKNAGK